MTNFNFFIHFLYHAYNFFVVFFGDSVYHRASDMLTNCQHLCLKFIENVYNSAEIIHNKHTVILVVFEFVISVLHSLG